MEQEKTGLKKKLFTALDKIIGDHTSPDQKSFKHGLRDVVRILIGSIKKFLDDEALLRAASISYSLVVSFVPVMVVALLVGAKIIEKEKYFLYAREFIRKQGIPIDPDPYINIINELLNNANAVTGIGFLVLLFTATSALRNLEDAMNRIWMVKKGRPWIQKISGFLLVLIFGPILLTVGISLGQRVVNQAAPPDLVSFEALENKTVITGEKATYLTYTNGKWNPVDIVSNIDFEARKDTILFNKETNSILSPEEKEPHLPKLYNPSVKDISWRTFVSYASQNGKSWILTDNGCIINNIGNDEKLWDIQCYEREDFKLLFDVHFNKIKMYNDQTGYIIGNKGLILRTDNGGKSWVPNYIKNIDFDLYDIQMLGRDKLVIVGDTFSSLVSEDNGMHWKLFNEVTQLTGKDRATLNRIYKHGSDVWITGDYGTLLHSSDDGKTWKKNNLGINNIEFKGITFINDKEGVIIGEKGFIRYTDDAGTIWKPTEFNTKENLTQVIYNPKENKIYITGTRYEILKNTNEKFYEFSVIQKSPFARTMLSAFGSFILPFIVIGIIFFLLYKVMPFTEVVNKAAIYGAAVTSLLWVVFLLVFKYYVSSFSKGTFAIYGTLAAIPLVLLLVYTSVSIMLFGAEIAFFIQNPGLLKLSGLTMKVEKEKRQMWFGLKMLYILYNNYDKGNGSTKEADLVRVCHNNYTEFYSIIEKFTDRNILEKTGKNRYTPVVSPATLKMNEIMDDIDPTDYHIPETSIDNQFKTRVENYFNQVKSARSKVFNDLTFAQIFYGDNKP
ncbi:MAG: YihY/virulence factor BrkB family protein [Spirochaetia bacterium]|nr:YihY/virulence factor BrkB family protein [Spirochaetia bacterium]